VGGLLILSSGFWGYLGHSTFPERYDNKNQVISENRMTQIIDSLVTASYAVHESDMLFYPLSSGYKYPHHILAYAPNNDIDRNSVRFKIDSVFDGVFYLRLMPRTKFGNSLEWDSVISPLQPQ